MTPLSSSCECCILEGLVLTVPVLVVLVDCDCAVSKDISGLSSSTSSSSFSTSSASASACKGFSSLVVILSVYLGSVIGLLLVLVEALFLP